jgi:hypothetical protein
MPKIIIGTDVVNFPDSGSDALWSPAVIQFAELVASQLLAFASPYDFAPTVYKLQQNNAPTSTFVIGATFDGTYVRKFTLNYSIYRVVDYNLPTENTVVESGVLTGTFNTETQAWTLQDEFNGDKKPDGSSYHSFSINALKQIELQTQYVSGTIDPLRSAISWSAKTELVSLT